MIKSVKVFPLIDTILCLCLLSVSKLGNVSVLQSIPSIKLPNKGLKGFKLDI